MLKKQIVMGVFAFILSSMATCAAIGATISTCFTPGDKCAPVIISAISGAKNSVYVQACQLTAKPFADAMRGAKNRGLDVQLILDKTQLNAKTSQYFYLVEHKIPIYIDNKVAIAHNKVIIIDGNTVLTGSYNYTKNAENRNAENVIIIKDDDVLAKQYIDNFNRRKSQSRFIDQVQEKALADKIEYDCKTNANEFIDYDFCRQMRLYNRHENP